MPVQDIIFVGTRQNESDKSIKISDTCIYKHCCFPSRGQLREEKRKTGAYTRAVHESQIKTILTVLNTKQKLSVGLLRELVRPLFHEDHCLDAKLLGNFRQRAEKLLASKVGEIDQMIFTPTTDVMLLGTDNLDAKMPEYLTDSFRLLEPLIEKAKSEQNDIAQIETFLGAMTQADPSFKYRRSTDANGNVTRYIWQTGVIRRDFELYGSTLLLCY
jgi:hypothetical protein